MDIAVELSRIIITETSPQQVIYLKEKNGARTFPILIGINEAVAIDRRLKGIQTVRPMTHELLAEVIRALGGKLDKIVIHDLRDQTFIAKLVINRDGERIEVDSRPSDAIALGVAFETPIFVADHVFEEVIRDSFSLASQRDSLELRRDQLTAQINKLRQRLGDAPPGSGAESENKRVLWRQLKEMQAELEAIEEILRHLSE